MPANACIRSKKIRPGNKRARRKFPGQPSAKPKGVTYLPSQAQQRSARGSLPVGPCVAVYGGEHALSIYTQLYIDVASRRVLSSFATIRNLLLKLSFFTNEVFIPSHLCNFKSSDAGGRLSRYLFQFDKIRSISARCFELICIIHSPVHIQKKCTPSYGQLALPM